MLRISIFLIAVGFIFQPLGMGEENLVVAVASDGDTLKAAVSETAGRCPYFLIFDSKGILLESVENPYKDAKGSAGVSAANILAEKNVTIVVAGKCGSKMKDALEAHEIAYFKFEGMAEDAVKKILEKEGRT
jgi:predicted Fe-Mo cluster-binding NifX family protein